MIKIIGVIAFTCFTFTIQSQNDLELKRTLRDGNIVTGTYTIKIAVK